MVEFTQVRADIKLNGEKTVKTFSLSAGFKINHLDLTPRFAGILMSFTNCFANFFGLLAPIVAGNIIEGKVNRLPLAMLLKINLISIA
jgi:hypothetical protein